MLRTDDEAAGAAGKTPDPLRFGQKPNGKSSLYSSVSGGSTPL